ncbi:hypothetical protein L2E82_03415 [Cichorium intybus]|uniref:Uncharacterized protein n=1 Tax=Cichorium intybus TaxID=13427 RepID=A0ACB9H610_CICIN|nr:hypothetical protein L2E82_03415 [Cichorium intybus]
MKFLTAITDSAAIILTLANFTVKGSLVYVLPPPSVTVVNLPLRWRIPWCIQDGKYLMEVYCVLRPGGFWILSGLQYIYMTKCSRRLELHRSAYCEAPLPPEILRAYLPRLIPFLLSNMAYAEDDESLLDAEDGSLPDRDQDLKPRFHSSRFHGFDDADDDVCLTSL